MHLPLSRDFKTILSCGLCHQRSEKVMCHLPLHGCCWNVKLFVQDILDCSLRSGLRFDITIMLCPFNQSRYRRNTPSCSVLHRCEYCMADLEHMDVLIVSSLPQLTTTFFISSLLKAILIIKVTFGFIELPQPIFFFCWHK